MAGITGAGIENARSSLIAMMHAMVVGTVVVPDIEVGQMVGITHRIITEIGAMEIITRGTTVIGITEVID